MKKSLLVIERIVLESLEKRERSLKELQEQTGMRDSLLKAVLNQLISRGIILYQNRSYRLNWAQKGEWLSLVQDRSGAKAEVKELLGSMVNRSFEQSHSQSMKMKKVWLEPIEEEELERKLRDIESFIEGVQSRRALNPVSEITCGKKVIVFGSCVYQELVDDLLKVG